MGATGAYEPMNRRTLLKLLPLSALAAWLRPAKRVEPFDHIDELPRTVNTNPQVWVRVDPDGKVTQIDSTASI